MRFLSLAFLLIFSLNVAAQSPAVSKLVTDGTRFANQGDFDQALQNYKTALLAAENEYLGARYLARLHYNIGVCHFRLGRYDHASDQFKSAILLDKEDARAHSALGIAQMRKRNLKAAVGSVKNVLN